MQELSLTGGTKTVTTAGTGVALVASETKVVSVVITALTTNTNPVHVGDSSVDKDTSQQASLSAGDYITLTARQRFYIDLAAVYVDAQTNGEGVSFLYLA